MLQNGAHCLKFIVKTCDNKHGRIKGHTKMCNDLQERGHSRTVSYDSTLSEEILLHFKEAPSLEYQKHPFPS